MSFLTEQQLAQGRLGLAEENHDIVLPIGVVPDKEPIARAAARLNDPFLDVDMVHVEEFLHFIFGDDVHAEFG